MMMHVILRFGCISQCQPHKTLVMVTHYAEELPTCITHHLYLEVFYKLAFMSICGCLHTLGRLLPLACIFLFFNQSRCPHRSFMQKRNLLRYRSTIDLGLIYRAPL